MESLKETFYKTITGIMNREITITNNGVQKEFEQYVNHLEKIMTHPRIKNQFTLALAKYKKETGTETSHHLLRINKWISEQPKNY